jgi:hypothetical protein
LSDASGTKQVNATVSAATARFVMLMIELARDTWVDRLNAFTMAHEGWAASLRTATAGATEPVILADLPLLGVSADHVDHDGTIAVSLRSNGASMTRVIRDVTNLYVGRANNGATAELLIVTADGSRTSLNLRARALPVRPSH